MKTKTIQICIIRAETAEQAIKVAKKGHKYFDFIDAKQIKCFEVRAVVEVKETDEATQQEILANENSREPIVKTAT